MNEISATENKNFNPTQFYERIAQEYPEEEINKNSPSQIALDTFVYRYLNSINGSLLDFGCGKGRFSCYYTRGPVVGIDIASSNISACESRCPGKDKTFLGQDITSGFNIGTFDNIICIEVLEHIPQWGEVVNNMYRSLNPNGTILITTPNKGKGWIKNKVLETYGIKDVYYHGGYSIDEMINKFIGKFKVKEKGMVPNVNKIFVKLVKI